MWQLRNSTVWLSEDQKQWGHNHHGLFPRIKGCPVKLVWDTFIIHSFKELFHIASRKKIFNDLDTFMNDRDRNGCSAERCYLTFKDNHAVCQRTAVGNKNTLSTIGQIPRGNPLIPTWWISCKHFWKLSGITTTNIIFYLTKYEVLYRSSTIVLTKEDWH